MEKLLNNYFEKVFDIFNLSNIILTIHDVEKGTFLKVNNAFVDLLNYTQDEVLGKTPDDINLYFEDHQGLELTQFILEGKQINDYEIVFKTKKGTLLTCLFSLKKFSIDDTNFLLATAINISNQKSVEKKVNYLYKQQKLLADISQLLNTTSKIDNIIDSVLKLLGEHTQVSRVYIFEDSPDGLYTNNTHEWCNENIEPQKEVLQDIYYSSIPSWKMLLETEGMIFSEDIKKIPEDVYNVLEPQGIKSILVYPLFFYNEIKGFIGFDECTHYKKWLKEDIALLKTVAHIISNAYERVQYVKDIEEKEFRLKLAIESAKEGLWDWNIKKNVFFFNDVFYDMIGIKKDEIEPSLSGWQSLIHPDDLIAVLEKMHIHIYGQASTYESIHRVRTKNGKYKWVLAHGMVIERDSQNNAVRLIGTYIDITKQKEIEEQLKGFLETKDKIFSVIAHDLRGAVNNFYNVLLHITTYKSISDVSRDAFLNELKKISENMKSLLENLLNWARIQTNSIDINRVAFCINDLIYESIDLMQQNAFNKNIQLKSNINKDILVYADQHSVYIVLRNLIENAIKFTHVNGKVEIKVYEKDKMVSIEVIDNGIGIEEEVLGKLFEENVFHTTCGTKSEKGAGIGLKLCHDFVKKNGGSMQVESVLNKGTTFRITLPCPQ